MCIQTLKEKGVEDCAIMQLTGHRNVISLDSYDHLTVAQQKEMSDHLTKKSAPPSARPSPCSTTTTAETPLPDDLTVEPALLAVPSSSPPAAVESPSIPTTCTETRPAVQQPSSTHMTASISQSRKEDAAFNCAPVFHHCEVNFTFNVNR